MRQARVTDRQLGRVNATVRVVMVVAQLFGTVFAGVVAEIVGLRAAAFIAPVFALVGAFGLYKSPVWRVGRTMEPTTSPEPPAGA